VLRAREGQGATRALRTLDEMTGRWSVALQSVALQLGETCNLGRPVSQPKGIKLVHGRRNRPNGNRPSQGRRTAASGALTGPKLLGVELVRCALLEGTKVHGGSPWLPAVLKAVSWG
jgi:hypothetical protein